MISVPAKTYALVAYLLLNGRGGPTPRASLRQFLWEESDPKTAATNLRKFLSRLLERQDACGCEMILSRRDHVELATDSVEVDLAEFQRIVACPRSADLIALCELYRGELIEGCEFEGGEVQEWLNQQRTSLRDTFISAIAGRLEPLDPDADKIVIRAAARRLLEVDSYNEVGHRALMRLFAEDSEPARVRDIYRSLEARLWDELGVEPDPVTTELFHSLVPGGPAKPSASGGETPRVAAAPASPEPEPEQPEPSIDEVEADVAEAAAPRRAGLPKVTILPPPPVAGQDYRHQIAVSLVDDVTISLCRYRTLSVVAPHTAWQLSVGGKKALLRSFGINYAAETQLQNRGGEFWLSVRLLNALSREIIWTEHYAFDLEPAARHYRDISLRILTSIVDQIERAELAGYDSDQNASAYHLYLSGQRYLRRLDLPNVRRARRSFRSAIGTCPDFVPGLSGLARTLQLEWLLRAHGDEEMLQDAERLAMRSIEIDPDDARGYRELGICRAYAGRFDESLSALAVGEQRNPQHADLLNDFAEALVHACEPALALEKIGQAIELNPLCPDQYWWAAAGANYQLEKYAEAVSCMERMHDQTPALRLLAASWGMLGNRERAADYARLTRESHPDFRIGSYLSIVPFRDQRIVRKYEEGLRAAGFEYN